MGINWPFDSIRMIETLNRLGTGFRRTAQSVNTVLGLAAQSGLVEMVHKPNAERQTTAIIVTGVYG